MANHVFTYGSLMFEPVWRFVVRGQYLSSPALISDYRRFAVRDETYPAVVYEPGARVEGRLYRDVDAADMRRLDEFEGADYRRISVSATLQSDRAMAALSAQLYLYLRSDRLDVHDWDAEQFERVGIDRFMATYCR